MWKRFKRFLLLKIEQQKIIDTLFNLSKDYLWKDSKNQEETEKNLKIAYKTISLCNELDYFPKPLISKLKILFNSEMINSGLLDKINKLDWFNK